MFSFVTVDDYHALLKNESLTCRQAVEFYLEQISRQQHLNAFLEVFAEESLSAATALDIQRKKGKPMGKLHGVIIAIKDVICYKGHRVSAASKILGNFESVYSATAVEKLLSEEAIIIGRTNCDEFAMGSTSENSAFGPVLNAWNETRVAGGSSGGSAVAVQAEMCMIALGSDTGGSVRQPADFCGIMGLKPSYGRVSRHGLIAYASSFDQIGIFGKTIRDVALTLEVISGADEFDSTVSSRPPPKEEEIRNLDSSSNKKKFRFVYVEEALNHQSIDPEIASSIKKLTVELKNEGHIVEAVEFDLLDYVVPAYYVLTTAEASSNLGRYDGVRYGYRTEKKVHSLARFYEQTRSEGFGKEVKRRILLGTFVLSTGYYDAYFSRAQKVRRLLKERTDSIFEAYDLLLLPVSPVTAFRAGEKMNDPVAMYLADIFTVWANLAGLPALSLPLFRHSNGMPFGIQLMAKEFDELTLLQAGSQITNISGIK